MLFARWRHHIRFASGFSYAPFKTMVTKISKWSRIQDFFRITPKTESLVAYAMPDIPSKFQKDPSRNFWVILLTHRQTNKVWQKHNLLGGGNNSADQITELCTVSGPPLVVVMYIDGKNNCWGWQLGERDEMMKMSDDAWLLRSTAAFCCRRHFTLAYVS